MRFWTIRGTPEHDAVVDAFLFVTDPRDDAWQWQARRAKYASTDS